MGIIDQFRLAVAGVRAGEDGGPAGLPIRLSRACVRVLPVVGAGLGLFSDPTLRIPVGASDDTAATAERLQFTVAEGPCFHAHRTGQPVVATEAVIADRWPLFHDQLVTQTPIRGIVSTPLGDGFSGVGVLDLYCHRSADVGVIDLDTVNEVVEHIGAALAAEAMFPNFRSGPPWNGPLWLRNPQVTARGYVLVAMGMISVALSVGLDDSLAALRAHAFATDRTLDITAYDIVNRTLPTADLAPDTNS